MCCSRILVAGVLACAVAMAQAPALVNSGKPMRLDFACTEKDFHDSGCDAGEPCPVYLELSTMETAGARIFLAGNIHTAQTTLYSVLLTSDDAGKSWREPFQRLRGTVLDQIQFLDFEAGWVSGQAVDNLPRDPFLLVTRDAGKSWQRNPVFSEGSIASIERFHFDSRTHGMLWADRTKSGETKMGHQSYETMNGGETWMLREVSETPIKYKLPPAPETGWRLRPDKASKSYEVEKLEGEKWRSIAGFLVELGGCKMPEEKQEKP